MSNLNIQSRSCTCRLDLRQLIYLSWLENPVDPFWARSLPNTACKNDSDYIFGSAAKGDWSLDCKNLQLDTHLHGSLSRENDRDRVFYHQPQKTFQASAIRNLFL